MKRISAKIIGLLVISFLVVSVLFAYTSINTLKQSQTENIGLFKEEFLELATELFGNGSNVFFYNLDAQSINKVAHQTTAQTVLNYIKQIDPQGKNIVVVSIPEKKLLEGYSNAEVSTLLDQHTIDNSIQENILNQKTDFDVDNFDAFTLDTTNSITPSKVHLRIYSDAGLMIGYNENFSSIKVRIQFIERQNDALYNSSLNSLATIFIGVAVITIALLIVLMRYIVIQPLIRITFGLKQVREGKLDTKLDISRHDEMGDIAVAFNNMTSDLKSSRAELEDYAKNLEAKVKGRMKESEEQNSKLEELNQQLQGKNKDLERMNRLMIDRELKMIDLKKQLAAIEKK